jgi:hypothetical protein
MPSRPDGINWTDQDPALLAGPSGVAVDAHGHLFIAASANNDVEKVTF